MFARCRARTVGEFKEAIVAEVEVQQVQVQEVHLTEYTLDTNTDRPAVRGGGCRGGQGRAAPSSLSGKLGTHKTDKNKFWPWQGQILAWAFR